MALAADDVAGKVLAIFFPIMAFVAMGFDHVVANMFFLPAAIFAGVPDLTWWDALHNWIFAFLGNLVGAPIFVAGAYWYLYVRESQEEPGDTPSGEPAQPSEAESMTVGGGREERDPTRRHRPRRWRTRACPSSAGRMFDFAAVCAVPMREAPFPPPIAPLRRPTLETFHASLRRLNPPAFE